MTARPVADSRKLPADTLPLSDLTLMAIDAKLGRVADATERQATALENLATLVAAVIGLADAECGDGTGGTDFKAVAYVRTGDGISPFNCDEAAGPV